MSDPYTEAQSRIDAKHDDIWARIIQAGLLEDVKYLVKNSILPYTKEKTSDAKI